MPCFHPLTAWQRTPGDKPVFSLRDLSASHTLLKVPCGKCIGCRLERSRKWAMRCVMEASLHEENSFITLTYDEEHLPPSASLVPRDLSLFWKRFRKAIGKPIRYFACGEYGERTQRPHYHAIIFGHQFEDRELWQKTQEQIISASPVDVSSSPSLYQSSLLSDCWSLGFGSVGDVTFESAAYVARYCLKKITGPAAEAHYHGREPEFVRMSNRPGIAAGWFEKYGADVYPSDQCFARGVPCKPPRYFDKLFELTSPDAFANLKCVRRALAQSKEDESPERLDTLEELTLRRMAEQTHRGL